MPSPPIGLLRTEPHVPACLRTGRCCELLTIDISPRQMREDFAKFSRGEAPRYHEIDRVAPMLMNVCLGAWDWTFEDRTGTSYAYGPCPNLTTEIVEGRRIASCGVHADKPYMCREYPFYGRDLPQQLRRGCGYMPAGAPGISGSKYRQLRPLRPDEA